MLTVQEIQSLMEEDISSEKKRFAKIGDRYYNGELMVKCSLINSRVTSESVIHSSRNW